MEVDTRHQTSLLDRLHTLLDRFLTALLDLRDEMLSTLTRAIDHYASHENVCILRELHGFLGLINEIHEDVPLTVNMCTEYYKHVELVREVFPRPAA